MSRYSSSIELTKDDPMCGFCWPVNGPNKIPDFSLSYCVQYCVLIDRDTSKAYCMDLVVPGYSVLSSTSCCISKKNAEVHLYLISFISITLVQEVDIYSHWN